MRPNEVNTEVQYDCKVRHQAVIFLYTEVQNMRKNLTEIVFILDRSGSMSGLETDTIGGFKMCIRDRPYHICISARPAGIQRAHDAASFLHPAGCVCTAAYELSLIHICTSCFVELFRTKGYGRASCEDTLSLHDALPI